MMPKCWLISVRQERAGKCGADEPLLMNFQNRGGYILPYQAKQLLEMVEKYATLSD
jgi:hypothetical protein